MNVIFDREFEKTFQKITDPRIQDRVLGAIQKLKSATTLLELKEVSKLKGGGNFYRYKFHDYRIGLLKLDSNLIILLRVRHRSDFYKGFP